MRNGRRKRRWVRGALLAGWLALGAGVVPPVDGRPLAETRGEGPAEAATFVCGYCAGAGLFMTLTETWVVFLSSPTSWGKLAGCATACYTMLT